MIVKIVSNSGFAFPDLFVRLKFQERSELKFFSRTCLPCLPAGRRQAGNPDPERSLGRGYNTPLLAAENGSRACPWVHTRDFTKFPGLIDEAKQPKWYFFHRSSFYAIRGKLCIGNPFYLLSGFGRTSGFKSIQGGHLCRLIIPDDAVE
jgi:hypothetical protein